VQEGQRQVRVRTRAELRIRARVEIRTQTRIEVGKRVDVKLMEEEVLSIYLVDVNK
jgi:positive regulator of sigma E activity